MRCLISPSRESPKAEFILGERLSPRLCVVNPQEKDLLEFIHVSQILSMEAPSSSQKQQSLLARSQRANRYQRPHPIRQGIRGKQNEGFANEDPDPEKNPQVQPPRRVARLYGLVCHRKLQRPSII